VPFSEDAVNWIVDFMAQHSSTLEDLHQRLLATEASIVGLLRNVAASLALATTTGGCALGPLSPWMKFTIYRWTSNTLIKQLGLPGRIARLQLFEGSRAKGSITMPKLGNLSRAHRNSIAT